MIEDVVILTEQAKFQLERLLIEKNTQCIFLELINKGCNGKSYSMSVGEAKEISDNDAIQPISGGALVIRANSIIYLLGATMDWKTTGLHSEFVWNNPNINSQCGCGKSVGLSNC